MPRTKAIEEIAGLMKRLRSARQQSPFFTMVIRDEWLVSFDFAIVIHSIHSMLKNSIHSIQKLMNGPSEDLAWISNEVDRTRFFMIFHADHTCSWESRCMGNGHQVLSVEYILVVQILLDSQRPRWVVEHHCCPRWLRSRQLRSRDQGLFLDLVFDLCLSQPLSKRTFLLKTDSSFTFSMSSSSPNSANISSSTCTSKNLQERTPDHRYRHPRGHGFPINLFCFAFALCAANFKPAVTWTQNDTAIVAGDHSSAVKRFIFVKKVLVLQGCLCILMASLTSRWERETAHLWAKISARTWTWTPQNDLITVKYHYAKLHAQCCCHTS